MVRFGVHQCESDGHRVRSRWVHGTQSAGQRVDRPLNELQRTFAATRF